MLKQAKIAVLRIADTLGVNALMLGSRWRRERLLILCYHGTSLEDEHQWNPSLYMPASLLRERLQAVRQSGCTVLPLEEALSRLSAGQLPSRSVVLTVDDGSYDFYRAAWPIVREFGYPVTVYFTTYYSQYNRPVFDPMCSYILWKARGRRLEWPGVLPQTLTLDAEGRQQADRHIKDFARSQELSGREKDSLLADLAARLSVDYEELCRKRILHLMSSSEAADLAAQGVDFQLHTHRHRVSIQQERFAREIEDNRRGIAQASAAPARHFCYPGGFHLPDFPDWLRQLGVVSATTCEVGLANSGTDPLLLPRLVDTTGLTALEFRAWLSGLAGFLPKRPHVMSEGQLMEEGP